MKTVHKYPLSITDHQVLALPENAEILTVALQGGPMLWVLVNPDAPLVTVSIYVRGTGHLVEEGLIYVGTFFEGPFVWHVFRGLQSLPS